MDRDHRHHCSSQRPVLKKRYSFDVTLLEHDSLFLAHDQNGLRDHSGTDISNSAPTSLMDYPLVSAFHDPTSISTPQHQRNSSLQENHQTMISNNEEEVNDVQQLPEGFATHDDFVLFRHPDSPQGNFNGQRSPSSFLMSPTSSLIVDNLFPDLSSLL